MSNHTTRDTTRHDKTSLTALAGLVASLLAAPALPASLQALPGDFNPYALSGDGGTVVGQTPSSGVAARWNQASGITVLGSLPGSHGSSAHAVSADGSVVVGVADDSPNLNQQAFRWTQAGGMVGLGYLENPGSEAHGVSADGSVVVGNATNADGNGQETFRWSLAGGMASLGVPSHYSGVSADGSVVAGRGPSGNFRWTEAGGLSNAGLFSISPYDPVSADGSTIVGSTGGGAAFWTPGGGVTELVSGNIVGGRANSASADGSVIVGETAFGKGLQAFVWDSPHGTRSLNSVLSSQGVDMTNVGLTSAFGISDDGRTVLAFGGDSNGNQGYYLARLDASPVPLPAAFWLFGTALAGLMGAARRKG